VGEKRLEKIRSEHARKNTSRYRGNDTGKGGVAQMRKKVHPWGPTVDEDKVAQLL